MPNAEWEILQEETWYVVTAQASCPSCGRSFGETTRRRKAAGKPETPPLRIQVAPDGTVELIGAGLFLPIATHRCES